MTPCLRCESLIPAGALVCPVCGGGAGSADGLDMPTFRYSGPLMGTRTPGRKSTPLARLFESRNTLVIGRYADCDICLSHPMISRWHALLERLPDGRLQVTDLGSINGVTVNGRRINGSAPIAENVPFAIGPFLFSMADGQLRTIDSSQSIRLEARHVEKLVKRKDGEKRKLLDDVNLVIEPGEFVGLLGPSGSGKSTLMDCLNGRRWATGGQVLANHEDFYRFFDSFRQSLGYVPQKDIVHTELTVMRALYYTARLRLPPDTDRNELDDRLFEVLRLMELQPHRDTLVGNLSGGQVKRVSLGAELLARPSLLFIDEATSGLDAGTEARMMKLFRRLADEGKSLVCITHNVENVDACHLVLILARGKLIYYGPPSEAPGFFGVSKITEIYDRVGEREPGIWEDQFRKSEFHQEFVAKRATSEAASPLPAATRLFVRTDSSAEIPATDSLVLEAAAARFRPRHPPILHQFRVLAARYAELIRGDSRSLRLLFLQAPIVAIILIIGFANKPYERTAPKLRHLTKPEKDILLVLKAIEEDLDADAPAPSGGFEVRFQMERLGVNQNLPAREVREMLRSLEASPVDSPVRKQLESVRLEIITNDVRMPVDLQQMSELRRLLRDDHLPGRLVSLDRVAPVVPGDDFIDPTFTYMLLFILVIVVMWFGCSNAAKEIVKEESIYGRERAVNLGIFPYLASKFTLLSLITFFQAVVLVGLVFGSLEAMHQWNPEMQAPPKSLHIGFPAMVGVMGVLSMTGVALGLLLSAAVSTTDRANTLLPYVLIPQIILGGGTLPVKTGVLYLLAVIFSPAYWAFRGVRLGSNDLPEYVGHRTNYIESAWLACGMLAAQMVVFLIIAVVCMRAKDIKRT